MTVKKVFLLIGIALLIVVIINILYAYLTYTPRIANPRMPVVPPLNPLSETWLKP